MILGGVTAVEKVGSFLLALDGRASNEGSVELPVTRYVVAEYLAVSVETVCRAIADLQRTVSLRELVRERSKFSIAVLCRTMRGESCKPSAPD
jgi:CRP-like cAMP-binding protein